MLRVIAVLAVLCGLLTDVKIVLSAPPLQLARANSRPSVVLQEQDETSVSARIVVQRKQPYYLWELLDACKIPKGLKNPQGVIGLL